MTVPVLPEPLKVYDRQFFCELLRIFRLYFFELEAGPPVVRAFSSHRTVTAAAISLGVADGGVIYVDTTSNAVTVTLPAAALSADYQFIVKCISAGVNNAVIQATSGNIDGAATATLATQYASLILRSDGTNYFTV